MSSTMVVDVLLSFGKFRVTWSSQLLSSCLIFFFVQKLNFFFWPSLEFSNFVHQAVRAVVLVALFGSFLGFLHNS